MFINIHINNRGWQPHWFIDIQDSIKKDDFHFINDDYIGYRNMVVWVYKMCTDVMFL